jgi:hypothetical protein
MPTPTPSSPYSGPAARATRRWSTSRTGARRGAASRRYRSRQPAACPPNDVYFTITGQKADAEDDEEEVVVRPVEKKAAPSDVPSPDTFSDDEE